MSYQDRQQSLKLMQAGYEANNLDAKMNEIKRAQAMQNVKLSEIEEKNPIRMISRGYQVLDSLKQPEAVVQLGGNEVPEKDEETQAVENHLNEVSGMSSKMDELLESMKQIAYPDEK